jgi:LDH2 family malate/lactate/ureidoglycolate dehydrogenase
MDSCLSQYEACPGTDGLLIPSDPEREAEAVRSKEGIPLIKAVVDELLDISRKAV